MFNLSNWFRLLVGRPVFRETQTISCISGCHVRTFGDTPDTKSNQIALRGTENEEQVRVRRARPSDVPRVLRFVREHALTAWPGLAAPPAAPQLMLCDYVARALSQGHSMLAEQPEQRRGWSRIRGLALCVAVCPWDASLLEKWARCVRCPRSRRLMAFTAHCLRAPALHDKYHVQKVLQVILIVPQDNNPKSAEIANMLAKNVIKRGEDVRFPVIRFDVTSDNMAKILEDLHLKKEWQLSYDISFEHVKDTECSSNSIKPENISNAVKAGEASSAVKPEESSNAVKAEDSSNAVKSEDPNHTVKAKELDNAQKVDDSSDDVKSLTTSKENTKLDEKIKTPVFKHRIAVYTALTQAVK